ncbi:MAG: secretin N-terminal domain-containing protein [Armatimonadota bacterium]|nr:hypothetical protein [bacterium]
MRYRQILCIPALVAYIGLGFATICPAQNNIGLYDVDSSSTDIKYVLEALARRSGANIVVSPDIAGDVSVHLKQMTIDSILEHLAKVQGFAWQKSGDTYLVADKERFAKPVEAAPTPDVQTVVWQCKNSRPSDMAAVIAKILPDLKAIEGPNLISPSLGSGGMSSDSDTLSSDSSTSGSVVSKNNSSTLILMGKPSDIAQAMDILTQLDAPRKQVNIEVSVVELSSNFDKELGTEWSWNDINLSEDTSTSGIWFGKYTKDATNITSTVSALIKNENGKLLAKPNISVLDNETAEILIGEKLLFPKISSYSDNGTPIYDKDEEKVGIYLQIAPKIAGDSDIVLSLYPQVSLVSGYLETDYASYPQISTREARTTVSVKNGSTLAIGGLIQDDEIKSSSKVPILGDLPIIGSFFRHSSTTKERTEIVIFLTPKIVEDN